MSKVANKLAIFVALGMMSAGSAWAAAGDLATTLTVVPTETVTTMKADISAAGDNGGTVGTTVAGNDAVAGITYTLGTSYVNNDTITFTLSAGKFKDTTYYLATQADTTNNDDLTVAPNGKTPFAMISKTDTTITFRVTDDTAQIDADGNGAADTSALIAGTVYYLVSNNNPDQAVAGTLNTAASAAGPTANPIVEASTLTTSGSKITLTVASQTSTGLVLDNTGTKTVDLVKAITQFTGAAGTTFNGVIDVNNSRKQFTGGSSDTNISWDKATVTVISDTASAITKELITTVAGDTLKITITAPTSNISGIFYDTNANNAYNAGTDILAVADTTAGTFTITVAGNLINGGTIGAAGVTTTQAVFAVVNDATFDGTVEGTNVIATRSFSVKEELTIASSAVTDTLVTAGTSLGAWSINGFQGVVPYAYANTVADTNPITTYCLVNNASTTDAAVVFADVVATEGTFSADLQNLSIGSVPAQASKLLVFNADGIYFNGETQLHQLASMGSDKRYAAKLTVAVPIANVTVNCFQRDPSNGTKRVIPVLVDNAGAGTNGYLTN